MVSDGSKAEPGVTEGSFRAFLGTYGLLRRVMDAYFVRFGLSGTQWGVLRILHRAKLEGMGELRLTDLGKRLLVQPPSVTGVINRLERAGLVARVSSTADKRLKHVRLTAAGIEIVERGLKVHSAQIVNVMSGLSLPQQQQLMNLLDTMESHLRSLL